jgi:hypothetical protein
MLIPTEKEKVTWFSMWFLASIASFGITFFPMFFRLIDNRNRHFNRQNELESCINEYEITQGRKPHEHNEVEEMNAKAWAASIVFIVPAFFVIYRLSKDLRAHEQNQEIFLDAAFPEKRMFMSQTIPIKKYALFTIVTLGLGGIYWLYKVINLYNAHFKAQWKVEEEIVKLMEDKKVGESM